MPNFRQHVRDDVSTWSIELRETWREVVETNGFGEWAKYPVAEVELRAWLDLRAGFAREPVILNRHHLNPSAPQALGSDRWPTYAIYCGRPPSTAPALAAPGGDRWRFGHLLGNLYAKDLYPDALERYRMDLRRWLMADRRAVSEGGKRSPQIDAIRSIEAKSALVCSCVSSPWTPTIAARQGEPLPPTVTCHCHLIVAAWRIFSAVNARHEHLKTVAKSRGG